VSDPPTGFSQVREMHQESVPHAREEGPPSLPPLQSTVGWNDPSSGAFAFVTGTGSGYTVTRSATGHTTLRTHTHTQALSGRTTWCDVVTQANNAARTQADNSLPAHTGRQGQVLHRTYAREMAPHAHTRAECRCFHPLDPVQRPLSTTLHAHTQGATAHSLYNACIRTFNSSLDNHAFNLDCLSLCATTHPASLLDLLRPVKPPTSYQGSQCI
jgi:hypothetical protein